MPKSSRRNGADYQERISQSSDLVVSKLDEVIPFDRAARKLAGQTSPHLDRISFDRGIQRFKSIRVFSIRLFLPLLDGLTSTIVVPLVVDHRVFRKAEGELTSLACSAAGATLVACGGGGHLNKVKVLKVETLRLKFLPIFVLCFVLFQVSRLAAEEVPVRHMEGVTLGFLALRNLDGQIMAYGELKQVVKGNGLVMDDLHFRFKDGSYFQEITRFTQRNTFRLVSDHVIQKGPSFKQESETWIDAATGKITVRTVDKGKEKLTTKHLDLPPDVSNGLLFTLVKNLDPAAPETTVSMVAASTHPRIVKLNILPAAEKTIKVGLITHKAQQYMVKVKIEGVAGVIAPLVGKQPPDTHVWVVKSEAPTFVESEGPLSQDSPVWRIAITAPEPESPEVKKK